MCGYTRRDMFKNEVIRDKVGAAAIVDKIRLRWFGHMKRKCEDVQIRRCERLWLFVAGGRPKKLGGAGVGCV